VTEVKGARVAADGAAITFPLPAVEVAVLHGLPLPGARTEQLKVLSESRTEHSLTLELEAAAGSSYDLKLHRNGAKIDVRAEGQASRRTHWL